MSRTRLSSFLLSVVVASTLFAVSGPQQLFAAEAKSASAHKDWSSLNGDWDTTFGKVSLSIEGNAVKGKYSYGNVTGTFEGTIDESGTITQTWKESDGKTGKAVLKVTSTGEIAGTWGFKDSHTDGVPTNEWKFTRPKK